MLKKYFFLLPVTAIFFLLPALSGPLLLDDTIHLGPIVKWLSTRSDTYELIFSNPSGPFGRPISILSFMLNALVTGDSVLAMKLVNLSLHLITGIFLSNLFFRLFRRDSNLLEHARYASIAAASLWLILPQHIATIFYVIQRMTLLSSLFAVIACWIYVLARERIENNNKNGALLFISVAVVTALSILSKETGLFIPFYCLLIELIYFRPGVDKPRPALVTWGFRLTVIYPGLLVLGYLALNPEFILGPYTDRGFSMHERAMTQISVLADYFASTFIPMIRSAGVFNDDFPIAHRLMMKESLLLLFGIGIIVAAIRLRKTYPSFSAGIGIFFIGHLLESTVFSLEIYFSHRNYMPSMGLILALFGLISGLLRQHADVTAAFKRMLPLAFGTVFLAYALASFFRAQVWSDNASLMAHAQIHHPTSSRLRSELMLNMLYVKQFDTALQQADIAMKTSPPNEKRTIQLWRILAYCYARSPIKNGEVDALNSMPADRITLATSTALGYVSAAAEADACPDLNREALAKTVNLWAVNTVQYPGSPLVWQTHLASARLFASGGDLQAGFKQAQWAFNDSSYDFDAGILALQLANSLGDQKHVDQIMTQLLENKSNYTEQQQSQLKALRKQLVKSTLPVLE